MAAAAATPIAAAAPYFREVPKCILPPQCLSRPRGRAVTHGPSAPKLTRLTHIENVRAAAVAGGPASVHQWHESQMERVLWTAKEIDARVEELGAAISKDFSGRPLAVVGVATGAFVFLADLVRKITLPVSVDLIRIQSYGSGAESAGVANLVTDIRIDVKGKHVLLVEDIVDTGISLAALVSHFNSKECATLSVCSLLDKAERRTVPVQLPDGGNYYYGFECPNAFVVGYGMDFAEKFRNLPYVGVLKPEVYIKG